MGRLRPCPENRHERRLTVLILLVLCLLSAACSHEDGGRAALPGSSQLKASSSEDRFSPVTLGGGADGDLSRFVGKKIGILTGSSYENVLRKQLPGSVPEYFNSFTDQTAAVKAGKIAGFLVDEPIARDIMNNTSGVTYIRKILRADGYAFAFPKDQTALCEEVNASIAELEAGGELRRIDARWFGTDEAAKVLPDLSLEGGNGVIRLAITSNGPPFVYLKNGRLVGYDIDLVMRIADKLRKRLEIAELDFGAIIPSLMSGRSDMAASCITITEERAKSVLFSTPYYRGGVVMVVAGRPAAGTSDLWSRLKESFRRTFLVEDRYKLVLQGLGVTVTISVLSAVIGTLLGFGVCLCRRASSLWASVPSRGFIRAVQGTPIVVILMILYYIVFGDVDISGILVAVVGFSINFAAYVSEMMRTGIEAVDRGQHEAAAALGFNRLQVFTRITFPQAARHVLPVFKGEFVSMVKMTSVVGYIAIQDLTKMSDLIRSRTYEAFFPLIATALIYFAVAYALTHLLTLAEARINPKRRKRMVKGVVLS
ncbi:MAG: ABC transporter permease subunit [Deltaproteobacteria bacterium]|nr:ABC transporter permease subunit [Deltaproteobacteria bacterium]